MEHSMRRTIVTLASAGGLILLWASAVTAGIPEPATLVKATLLADRSGVEPGGTLTLGVLLEMAPGWHTYWKHPGDAGLATQVTWKLPPGFAGGPLRWPTPKRFTQPGDIAGLGYEGSVLLTAQVTAPKGLNGKSVALVAEVAWLACRDRCVPGDATLRLELPVAEAAPPANEALFAEWAKQVPVPLAQAADTVTARIEGGIPPGGRSARFLIRLSWRVVAAGVDWFPSPPAGLAVENVATRTGQRETLIAFTARIYRGQQLLVPVLDSVVAHEGPKGERRGVAIPVPLRPPGLEPDEAGKTSGPTSDD